MDSWTFRQSCPASQRLAKSVPMDQTLGFCDCIYPPVENSKKNNELISTSIKWCIKNVKETYNNILADPVDGHTGQAVEFAFTVTVITELFQEVTAGIKHLYSMIGAVGHNDGIVGSNSYTSWPGKRSGFTATGSHLHQHLAFLHVLMSGRGRYQSWRRTCNLFGIATSVWSIVSRYADGSSAAKPRRRLSLLLFPGTGWSWIIVGRWRRLLAVSFFIPRTVLVL